MVPSRTSQASAARAVVAVQLPQDVCGEFKAARLPGELSGQLPKKSDLADSPLLKEDENKGRV
jgi:hypothetical protein